MDRCFRYNQCFTILALVFCAAALASAEPAHAQEPPSINSLVNVTSEFNSQQRSQVAQYASYWSAELLAEESERSRLAKRRLLEPFGVLGIRRIFRDEYSRAAIPELQKVIASRNTFAAVNAIQVVAAFQNEAALSVMRDHCGSREDRWQIRLWAARGIGRIAAEAQDIPGRTIDAAVRDLTRAGENETQWLVLQRQFEALAAINSQRSRESQISLLRSTLESVSADADGPSDMMQAVHRALLLLRNQLLDPNLPSAQMRQIGTEVGPLLGKVLEIGILHWETANVDASIRSSYDGSMALAESLLELVDAQVRGPAEQRPRLSTDWGNGNKSQFESDVAQWHRVLDAPPYAR